MIHDPLFGDPQVLNISDLEYMYKFLTIPGPIPVKLQDYHWTLQQIKNIRFYTLFKSLNNNAILFLTQYTLVLNYSLYIFEIINPMTLGCCVL